MVFASLLFAGMGVFAKLLGQRLPPVEVVFFRNIFGVFIITLSLWKSPPRQEGGRVWLLLFRGFAGFLALLLFFYTIAHIPLGEAMTYSKTSPIWTAIFAFLFLRELLTGRQWLAIGLGFVGMLLITDPFRTPFDRYDLMGLLSGMIAALAYTSVRELKRYYDTRAIVLSFMGIGTLGPLILMGMASHLQTPHIDLLFAPFIFPQGEEWLFIVAMGILATLAQIFMTKAYGATKAGVAGAASYTNILFSILFGTLFLGDPLPSWIQFLGIISITLGGVLVARK
ncbi:MAG: DMT family transporter [Epsilonproteobacteria bacterium]|nr:EamA family transporter [Campylobacterota bacterium]NPA56105.1 DMT family transporter [Campylobacterota bacterium]